MNISKRPILLLLLFTAMARPGISQVGDHNYQSTVHTFNEAWNTGEVDLLDEVVHPEYLKLEGDLELKGIEALKEYVRNYRASYVDVKIMYVDEIYGKEKAAINFIIEATPKESGKKFKSEGIVIFHFLDGKIIEDHSVFDQLSALKQQGYKIIDPE
ncbi:MAG: ester cyclase [Bacteroidales bacterium]|nr:ester cyclase [Bacteroidales bacterium]